MPGNSFGQLFRITTFGESHGGAVGVVVDGCPPGVSLSEQDIQPELDRRKPGQSELTTPRKEEDTIQILSGVFEGRTTGTPILIVARNRDVRSEDYHEIRKVFRPSPADFTYLKKYGIRDWRGSGRASARETLARVASGAIARKILREACGVEILSYVEQIGSIRTEIDPSSVTLEAIERSIVRCPDEEISAKMAALVAEVRDAGDSIGGIIRGVVRHVPTGLGEPVFDQLHADLGKAMLSINAAKGFEIGSGFAGVELRGSVHNDPFGADADRGVRPRTNRAGGVLGGISSGEDLVFRVAFKPVATISTPQQTVTIEGQETTLEAKGRHDPCVVPRAVPIVDAMAALVLIDHYLRQRAMERAT
jgi:chorismate synthase